MYRPKMRFGGAAFLLAALSTAGTALAADGTPLPNDVLGVAKIPAYDTHRTYVVDLDIGHIVDGRVNVFDGDTHRFLGMLSSGFAGSFALSPDGKNAYVATTYYERLVRGKRNDVVDVYDSQTLTWQREIPIPAKHAEASPYPGLASTSHDGKYLFVQNATPASSVTVVDLQQNKFVAEIGTAGCWTAWPSPLQNNRFSSVCGDGTILTQTFDETGKVTTSQRSEPVFDPEADPMFVQGAVLGDGRVAFVTFHGILHVVNITGEVAVAEPAWSVVPPSYQSLNWRPGGYQMLAYHKKTGRLFITMHKNGKEGSHKTPADEIWVLDLARHQILQQVPGLGALSLNVTQDDSPKLYALTAEGSMVDFSAAGNSVTQMGVTPHVGESATEIVTK